MAPQRTLSEISDDSTVLTDEEPTSNGPDDLATALLNVNLLWELPPIPPPDKARRSHYTKVFQSRPPLQCYL